MSNLTRHYDSLTSQYGSYADRVTYQQSIAQWYIQAIDDRLTALKSAGTSAVPLLSSDFSGSDQFGQVVIKTVPEYESALHKVRSQVTNLMVSSQTGLQSTFEPQPAYFIVTYTNRTCWQWVTAEIYYQLHTRFLHPSQCATAGKGFNS